jgi:CelD/BcsL family acetyltransferase involved in cellulose biosynthesis
MSERDSGPVPYEVRLTPLSAPGLSEDWTRLCDEDALATVFTTPVFQRALFGAFARPEAQAAELRQAGRTVGVVPLAPLPLRRGPITLRELGFFRGAHTLRNTMLIPPDGVAARSLLAALQETVRFDSLLFQNIPAEGPIPALLSEAAVATGMAADEARPGRKLMFADMPDGYDTYLETRSGNHRRQLRKRSREMLELGRLEIARLTGEALVDAIPDWKAIVDRSWQGQDDTGVGNTADDWAFHRALAGNGALFLMRLDGQAVASLRLLEYRDTAYVHTMNFDRALRDSAPGLVLFDHGLRDCTSRGLKRLDFNGNSEFYSRWATGETAHVTLRFYRRSLRGRAAQMARRLGRR